MLELVARGARGESRWLFAGALPGLTAAFVTLPDGTPFVVALTAVVLAALASLGALAIADVLRPSDRPTLTAIWGTAALVTFLWGNIPSAARPARAVGRRRRRRRALGGAGHRVVLAGAWLGRSLRLIARDRAEAADRAAALEALRSRVRERGTERSTLAPVATNPLAASASPQGQARAAAVSAGVPAAADGVLVVTTNLPGSSPAPAVAGEPPVPVPDRRSPARADRDPSITFWPSGV